MLDDDGLFWLLVLSRRNSEQRHILCNDARQPVATNKRTLEALQRIAKQLEELGVKSDDLKILKMHIGQADK